MAAKAIALSEVPPVPKESVGTPQHNGDVIHEDGVHRWRIDADGKIVYYIRYTSPKRVVREANYDGRTR